MRIGLLGNNATKFASQIPSLEHAAGTISTDRSAVVGRDGWVFIYEGSNYYRSGYLDKDVKEIGAEWASLTSRRKRECEALGARFLQLIVPNKLSVLPQCFPEELETDISFILQNFMASQRMPDVVVPLDTFRSEDVRHAVFRRNDSHLTVAGNALLTELVLKNLGLPIDYSNLVVTRRSQNIGDLGDKFSPAVEENLAVPSFDHGLLDHRNIYKVREIVSPGHTGAHQVFVNPVAPIKAKIVVFGNSFFERVPSWGMSPFFAALFTEYHFFWNSEVDLKYVAKERPDYVIAQTCERFMPKLPQDRPL